MNAKINWCFDEFTVDSKTNKCTVRLKSSGGLLSHVFFDDPESMRQFLQSRYGLYPRIRPDYSPMYYDSEGGSMCNGIGRDYF